MPTNNTIPQFFKLLALQFLSYRFVRLQAVFLGFCILLVLFSVAIGNMGLQGGSSILLGITAIQHTIFALPLVIPVCTLIITETVYGNQNPIFRNYLSLGFSRAHLALYQVFAAFLFLLWMVLLTQITTLLIGFAKIGGSFQAFYGGQYGYLLALQCLGLIMPAFLALLLSSVLKSAAAYFALLFIYFADKYLAIEDTLQYKIGFGPYLPFQLNDALSGGNNLPNNYMVCFIVLMLWVLLFIGLHVYLVLKRAF
jgi:hypothetical protein